MVLLVVSGFGHTIMSVSKNVGAEQFGETEPMPQSAKIALDQINAFWNRFELL